MLPTQRNDQEANSHSLPRAETDVAVRATTNLWSTGAAPFREMLCVTAFVLFLTWLDQFIYVSVSNEVATALLRQGIGWESSVRAFSLVMMAIFVLAVGSAVGLMAKRQTMVASLIVANIVSALWGEFVAFDSTRTQLPGLTMDWGFATVFTLPSLFVRLTLAFTQVAVALYVTQKFRKSA